MVLRDSDNPRDTLRVPRGDTWHDWVHEVFWPGLIWLAYLLMAAGLISGCGTPPPPDHVSIQPGFSESETTVIRSALDAWCDAVGWCPSDAIWVDRGRIELVDHIDQGDAPKLCSTGKTCQVSAENDGDNVNVLRDRHVRDLDTLWIEVAHEIGHYCTGHTATGLMAAVHDAGEPLVIDDVAVAAWRAGCP